MRGPLPFLEFDPVASPLVVSGTLGGRLEEIRAAVPTAVRVVSGRLEWIPTSGEGVQSWWPDGGNAARALGAFIRLATDPREERIAEFVRTYGVLGLLESGQPACGASHSLAGPPQLQAPWQGCAVPWEPIAAYQHYAAGAKAMLSLAAALRLAQGTAIVDPTRIFLAAGLPVDEFGVWNRTTAICRVWQDMSGRSWDEWWTANDGYAAHENLRSVDPAHIAVNFAYARDLYGPLDHPAEFAATQRQKFGYWLSEFWLKRAGLVPTVTWSKELPQLGLSVGGKRKDVWEHWPANSLFRIIAAHLAAIVCSGAPMATCSNCGEDYLSSRRQRADQAHYCEVCKPTAGSRRTQRWRERRRISKQ